MLCYAMLLLLVMLVPMLMLMLIFILTLWYAIAMLCYYAMFIRKKDIHGWSTNIGPRRTTRQYQDRTKAEPEILGEASGGHRECSTHGWGNDSWLS